MILTLTVRGFVAKLMRGKSWHDPSVLVAKFGVLCVEMSDGRLTVPTSRTLTLPSAKPQHLPKRPSALQALWRGSKAHRRETLGRHHDSDSTPGPGPCRLGPRRAMPAGGPSNDWRGGEVHGCWEKLAASCGATGVAMLAHWDAPRQMGGFRVR